MYFKNTLIILWNLKKNEELALNCWNYQDIYQWPVSVPVVSSRLWFLLRGRERSKNWFKNQNINQGAFKSEIIREKPSTDTGSLSFTPSFSSVMYLQPSLFPFSAKRRRNNKPPFCFVRPEERRRHERQTEESRSNPGHGAYRHPPSSQRRGQRGKEEKKHRKVEIKKKQRKRKKSLGENLKKRRKGI